MPYDKKQWTSRHGDRVDISIALTHLTREATIDGVQFSAVDVLLRILQQETIVGSTTNTGFIVGARSAVCFQDAPLLGLAQNIRFERRAAAAGGKVRYRGVGLAFHKGYCFLRGARPVIYEDTNTAKAFVDANDHWRIVRLDLKDPANMIDWTHEREWRALGDFPFERRQAAVIVENRFDYAELIDKAPPGLLKEVIGVTVLSHATM